MIALSALLSLSLSRSPRSLSLSKTQIQQAVVSAISKRPHFSPGSQLAAAGPVRRRVMCVMKGSVASIREVCGLSATSLPPSSETAGGDADSDVPVPSFVASSVPTAAHITAQSSLLKQSCTGQTMKRRTSIGVDRRTSRNRTFLFLFFSSFFTSFFLAVSSPSLSLSLSLYSLSLSFSCSFSPATLTPFCARRSISSCHHSGARPARYLSLPLSPPLYLSTYLYPPIFLSLHPSVCLCICVSSETYWSFVSTFCLIFYALDILLPPPLPPPHPHPHPLPARGCLRGVCACVCVCMCMVYVCMCVCDVCVCTIS